MCTLQNNLTSAFGSIFFNYLFYQLVLTSSLNNCVCLISGNVIAFRHPLFQSWCCYRLAYGACWHLSVQWQICGDSLYNLFIKWWIIFEFNFKFTDWKSGETPACCRGSAKEVQRETMHRGEKHSQVKQNHVGHRYAVPGRTVDTKAGMGWRGNRRNKGTGPQPQHHSRNFTYLQPQEDRDWGEWQRETKDKNFSQDKGMLLFMNLQEN